MDAYQTLAEKHGCGHSVRYRRILEFLMTPRQAELATHLPAPVEELARKVGLGVAEVKKEIDDLFYKGVVVPKDFATREGARFCRSVGQLHDATEADYRTEELYGARAPRLWELWEDFCRQESYPRSAKTMAGRAADFDRVIPAYRAIQGIAGVIPYDDVREVLKANSPIAVAPCACRRQARKTAVIVDSCMQFGRGAEYHIARGSGRRLAYEEALAVIDQAEEDGEVHIWPNARVLIHREMCNCTNDACMAWTPLVEHGIPLGKRAAKSRFEARVDAGLCNGCQVCVERCQFEAIEMAKLPGSKKLKAVIDPAKCWGCGVCVIKCQPVAISMHLVRPLEHIPLERPPFPS